jgi:glycosyltransferase 2 family protein
MKKVMSSLIVTLIILSIIVYILKDVDFIEVWRLIGTVDLRLFFLAVVLFGVSFVFWNFRLQNSLRGLQKIKFFELFRYLFVGIFFNTLTPGAGVGGEPVNAYLLGKTYKKPSSKFFGVILGDKSFHLMVYVLFLIFSLVLILFVFDIPLGYKILFGIIFSFVFFLVGLFIYAVFNKFNFNGKFIAKFAFLIPFIRRRYRNKKHFEHSLARAFNNVGGKFRWVVKSKSKLFLGILYSFGFWLSTFGVSYILFRALGFEINFIYVIVALSIGYFFGDLSPSPGGIGIMEAALILIYSAIGIPLEIAFSVALLDRVISLFYRLGLGGLATLSFSEKLKSFRNFQTK